MAAHEVPADLQYTAEHEWVRLDGDLATVGITAYAAEALGEVVFASVPQPGDTVEIGDVTGEVESHKSVSEIFAPVAGEITASNEQLEAAPELVSSDPYGEGWLFRILLDGEPDHLLDAAAYEALLEEQS